MPAELTGLLLSQVAPDDIDRFAQRHLAARIPDEPGDVLEPQEPPTHNQTDTASLVETPFPPHRPYRPQTRKHHDQVLHQSHRQSH